MPDPYRNLATASPDIIDLVAATLEHRAQDPAMLVIIDAYLDEIDWSGVHTALEVGCGTGPICRMMALRAPGARIVGLEPSPQLVERAQALAKGIENLQFRKGDGAALPFGDGSADLIVMHTVLSHVTDPALLLAEAARVLAPGGTLVVCDGDLSKATLGSAPGDPMQAVADYFAREFVTDAHLSGRLRTLTAAAGFRARSFRMASRFAGSDEMRTWVAMAGAHMVERGLIGRPFADALLDEHDRRLAAGVLCGYRVFVTLVATRP